MRVRSLPLLLAGEFMNEHDIFLKASELTDLAARSAYLDLTCGDNSELRQRVENLLLEHDDGNGLQTPDTITVQVEESDSQSMKRLTRRIAIGQSPCSS